MSGDGWKELSTIYPRECCLCGRKVALKQGAFFSAKVKGGKIVKAESTCHLCLAEKRAASTRCIYCGHPTQKMAPVCTHHSDLEALEAL